MERFAGVAQLIHLTKTASTQALARRMAEKGEPEWTLVWADRQTKGQGRMGRRWESGPGGLYVSIILRPKVAPKRLAELSLAAADAVAKAVNEAADLKTAVKPPNDVLAEAPGPVMKKICGILIEASGGARQVDWVVIGIGVNVNNRIPKSLPDAASLRGLTGREFEVASILRKVLSNLQLKFRAFLAATNGHVESPML